jgi:hypothetical protein
VVVVRADDTKHLNQLSFRRYAYTLEFGRNLQNRWRPGPPIELDLVVPVIDGLTVQEILDHDGFAGLPAHYVEPRARQWSGPASYGDDGLAAIIDGGCSNVGCCGVQASIEFHDTTVRWFGFKIGTGEPDTREYTFDRASYEAAIAGIASLSPTPVRENA